MTDDSRAALRPGAPTDDPDLGFFAAPRPTSTDAAPFGADPFGTSAPSDLPFGAPGRVAAPRTVPVPASRRIAPRMVALALVGTLAVVGVVGGLLVRTWQATGKPLQTTVATPAQVGDLVRTSLDAPTLTVFEPDVTKAVPMRTPRLATYVRGSATAEVLAARPLGPMDPAAQSRVVSAVSESVDRLTGLPLQLAPVLQGTLSGPLSCSQVQLQETVQVACVGTTSGAVVLVLVSGVDYAEATQVAAQLRAGVAQRG